MSLSPQARRVAQAHTAALLQAEKARLSGWIDRICQAATPPLSRGELSEALGLPRTELGRGVSPKTPSLPDRPVRGALQAAAEGALLLAVTGPLEGRQVLLCTPPEAARLGAEWQVVDPTGKPVAGRPDTDWDDDLLWADPFDREAAAAPASAPWPARPIGPADDALWVPPVGLGAMRLSTEGRPTEAEAVALLHAAWDAGLTFVDTADVYGLSEADLHHNERLIARARATWAGDAGRLVIATKGGLIRKAARWLPAGDPERLVRQAAASRQALGVERLDLYLLHAPDKRVPWAEQVAALARLKAQGVARHVGLCNLTEPAQLQEALAQVPIAAVQIPLSPLDGKAVRSGLVDVCAAAGVAVIAHSPLGGWRKRGRVAAEAAFATVAGRRGLTPEAVALAWLVQGVPHLIAIPGATRLASVRSSAQALTARLTDGDRRALATKAPFLAAPAEDAGEAVVILGPPASGKTSRVQPWLDQGYERLNRDERGGTLAGLLAPMEAALGRGQRRFVLDNTWPTVESRAGLMTLARRHHLPVRCVWVDATVEQCRLFAARRMIQRHGRLLDADEIMAEGKRDPNMLPPVAIDRWFHRFEPPTAAEGFAHIERVPVAVTWGPEYTHKAVFLDYDGTLRDTPRALRRPFPKRPEEVEILPGRVEKLAALQAEGWILVGVSNQAGVALGQLTEAQARECIAHTNRLLGVPIDAEIAPGPAGPPVDFTRKPMPGLAVHFIEKYRLDPGRCVMVGDRDSDRAFAQGAGLKYLDAADFFG
ncbi:MAG: HAD-IIIA family hydrolase [Myxococcales bacterium]|nr:HAD-IIIA family hydrolase [Myxococcales bacterium]